VVEYAMGLTGRDSVGRARLIMKKVNASGEDRRVLLPSRKVAQPAIEKLADLQNCEVHLTHTLTPGDEAGLRKPRVNLNWDPEFATGSLFIGE
jgi:uncharacterized protein (UPF0371 family)